jgi:hypothetical protein
MGMLILLDFSSELGGGITGPACFLGRIRPERFSQGDVAVVVMSTSLVCRRYQRLGYPSLWLLTRVGQESLDVRREFGVVLEQEPVRRIRIDLDASLRDQAG